jgi:hypothetical protein
MSEMPKERYVNTLSRLNNQLTALRHYSYECKAAVQERPYNARPSRTQQLHNPKLVPELTSDKPNDLLKKYVYDRCLKTQLISLGVGLLMSSWPKPKPNGTVRKVLEIGLAQGPCQVPQFLPYRRMHPEKVLVSDPGIPTD